MTVFVSRILRIAAALALLITFAPEAAFSQDAPVKDKKTSTWHTTLPQQLSHELRSSNEGIRDQMLQLVIFYAGDENFDLRPTVPVLLDIYASDDSDARRMLAVSALSAIGDDYGMFALEQLVNSNFGSENVRKVAASAVTDHKLRKSGG